MSIWTDKIVDLESKGLSLVAIAEFIGMTPAAVSELKQGRTKEPRFTSATKLLALHVEHCGTSGPSSRSQDGDPPEATAKVITPKPKPPKTGGAKARVPEKEAA